MFHGFRVPKTRCPGGLVRFMALALLGLFLLGQASPALAQDNAPSKVVLILATGLTMNDLEAYPLPHIRSLLAERGAVALMNTRTGGQYNLENGYATLGASARGLGFEDSGLTLAPGDICQGTSAPALYQRNTTWTAPKGAILVPGIAVLKAENDSLDHPVTPGLLGDSLHKAGKKIALIGNSNGDSLHLNMSGTVAMDARGIIDGGDISDALLTADPLSPFGVRTDYAQLIASFRRFYPAADLVVVETGDTLRLEKYRSWLSPDAAERDKRMALVALDGFIGELVSAIDWETTRLLLVSPQAPLGIDDNRLSVVLAAGKDTPTGWLISGTTRRPGLVANTDVAPTILSWLGVPVPHEVNGKPVSAVAHPDPVPGLIEDNQRILRVFGQRTTVLQTYVILQIITILVGILFLFLVQRIPNRLLRGLQYALVWVTVIPLLILLIPPFFSANVATNFVVLGLGAMIFTFLAVRWAKNPLDPFLLIYTLTAAAIAIDVSLGSPLIKSSLLGYDPMGGARFYGIGNEFMGVFIGSAILAVTLAGERWLWFRPFTTLATGIGFVLGAYVVGAAWLGANVGGAISVMVAFAWTWFALRHNRIQLRSVLIIGATVSLVIVGMAVYDASLPGGGTHLGSAFTMVKEGGITQLVTIAVRKLSMNWKLMKYTYWSRGLIAFIAAFIVLAYRPVGLFKKVTRRYPILTKGLWGSLAGAVAAFIANDSGVVAAALMMIYPTVLYVYLAMEEIRLKRE